MITTLVHSERVIVHKNTTLKEQQAHKMTQPSHSHNIYPGERNIHTKEGSKMFTAI